MVVGLNMYVVDDGFILFYFRFIWDFCWFWYYMIFDWDWLCNSQGYLRWFVFYCIDSGFYFVNVVWWLWLGIIFLIFIGIVFVWSVECIVKEICLM